MERSSHSNKDKRTKKQADNTNKKDKFGKRSKADKKSDPDYIDQTQSQAIARFNLFEPNSDITYELAIHMQKKSTSFKGFVTISFTLSTISKDFFLDLDSKIQIQKFLINGEGIHTDMIFSEYRKGNQLYPPNHALKTGHNTITIFYSGKYNTDVGFVSLKDNNRQYIYCTLQPYQAHYLTPCFDQPDLKAHFAITLIVHESWKAISNERCVSTNNTLKSNLTSYFELDDDEVVHEFAKTKPLSTYMVQVAAGDWEQIDGKEKYKSVDFRIFFRPEYKAQAKKAAPNVFKTLLIGFKFFEEFTGTEYPFGKYDTIFAPENSAEALESTGAVSFDEEMLESLDEESEEFIGYVDLTLHELAHQWFGNLVTLKWWGDLWLNEGFTVFLSRLGTWRHEFEGVSGDDKAENYQDPLDSLLERELEGKTHCLSCKVANTDEGGEVFDEIMYDKGSYAVTQLYFYMGEENFKRALKAYFDAFKFKNVTAADMVSVFSQFSSLYDMRDFEKDWIYGEGVSELQVEWNSTSDNHITIKQKKTKSEHNSCKKMKVRVGFFDWTGALLEAKDVVLERDETKVSYDSHKISPQIIFPNCERFGYAQVELDPISDYFYHKYEVKIADPITKIDIDEASSEKKPREKVIKVSEGELKGLVSKLKKTGDNLEFDKLAEGALKTIENCDDDDLKSDLFDGFLKLAVELGAHERFKKYMLLQLMCEAVATDKQVEILKNFSKNKTPGGWILGDEERELVKETLKVIKNS